MSDGQVPDLGNLMNIAQKLQGEVAKMQDDLARKEYEASAGGGMVKAVVNGQYEVVRIMIDRDVVDPDDTEMLQDLVIAAVNQALVKVREAAQSEMSKLTGGMNIPGMPSLF
ncbi:MAG: YbaB/EbfC family nucleoid-associated protein [Proteobacteria bacterium]|nr:YbaB/EbfC family nucleoid-associated protein [Pseudomonadota bacterium]